MTISKKIQNHILEQIREGVLKPGSRLDSRAKFMKKFSCARATVDLGFAELIQKKILFSVNGSGTFVKDPKISKKTKNIAIVGQSDIFLTKFNKGIIDSIIENLSSDIKVEFYTYDELKLPSKWQECKKQKGIIFILPNLQDGSFLVEARALSLSHIVVYRDHPQSSYVSIDNINSTIVLVDYLVKMGKKRIACVGCRLSENNNIDQRFMGYLQGLNKHGLEYNPELIGYTTVDKLENSLDSIFKVKKKPDAIISLIASTEKVIKSAEKNGFKIDENLTIASFDYIPKNVFDYKIPSLNFAVKETGKEVVNVLEMQFKSPKKINQKYIQLKVVE